MSQGVAHWSPSLKYSCVRTSTEKCVNTLFNNYCLSSSMVHFVKRTRGIRLTPPGVSKRLHKALQHKCKLEMYFGWEEREDVKWILSSAMNFSCSSFSTRSPWNTVSEMRGRIGDTPGFVRWAFWISSANRNVYVVRILNGRCKPKCIWVSLLRLR
jgi:hypothetical protein